MSIVNFDELALQSKWDASRSEWILAWMDYGVANKALKLEVITAMEDPKEGHESKNTFHYVTIWMEIQLASNEILLYIIIYPRTLWWGWKNVNITILVAAATTVAVASCNVTVNIYSRVIERF